MPAGVAVALKTPPDGSRTDCGNLLDREHVFERLQAAGVDRLADMRVIEDDEIVLLAEIGDGMRFEPFERMRIPLDRKAVHRTNFGGGSPERPEPPGVVPGQTTI
jgi:hypothetical protein